jgi:hypothetical protein
LTHRIVVWNRPLRRHSLAIVFTAFSMEISRGLICTLLFPAGGGPAAAAKHI